MGELECALSGGDGLGRVRARASDRVDCDADRATNCTVDAVERDQKRVSAILSPYSRIVTAHFVVYSERVVQSDPHCAPSSRIQVEIMVDTLPGAYGALLIADGHITVMAIASGR
jgi:hypothetical protein